MAQSAQFLDHVPDAPASRSGERRMLEPGQQEKQIPVGGVPEQIELARRSVRAHGHGARIVRPSTVGEQMIGSPDPVDGVGGRTDVPT